MFLFSIKPSHDFQWIPFARLSCLLISYSFELVFGILRQDELVSSGSPRIRYRSDIFRPQTTFLTLFVTNSWSCVLWCCFLSLFWGTPFFNQTHDFSFLHLLFSWIICSSLDKLSLVLSVLPLCFSPYPHFQAVYFFISLDVFTKFFKPYISILTQSFTLIIPLLPLTLFMYSLFSSALGQCVPYTVNNFLFFQSIFLYLLCPVYNVCSVPDICQFVVFIRNRRWKKNR